MMMMFCPYRILDKNSVNFDANGITSKIDIHLSISPFEIKSLTKKSRLCNCNNNKYFCTIDSFHFEHGKN